MQVVIALVVTPEGLPLAYEVLAGNITDDPTLHDFLARIERQYGRARRIWAMDRGIPTEAVLQEMRESDPPVHYLVVLPKGRLSRFEEALLAKVVAGTRPGVDVKLLPKDGGTLCLRAEPGSSKAKGTGDTPTKLKRLWASSQTTLGDDPHKRGAVDEARRRARQGPVRLASGRSRSSAEKEASFRVSASP